MYVRARVQKSSTPTIHPQDSRFTKVDMLLYMLLFNTQSYNYFCFTPFEAIVIYLARAFFFQL